MSFLEWVTGLLWRGVEWAVSLFGLCLALAWVFACVVIVAGIVTGIRNHGEGGR